MFFLAELLLCISRQWNAAPQNPCIKIVRHGGEGYFSKKATNTSGLSSPSTTRKGRVMTGTQLPTSASEDPKQHPYLWNHWCCNCPGHRLTHRWAVGSGHHIVLLAALKACGGLSGFEEKVLCETRWKWHMVNSLALCGRRQAAPHPAHTPAAPTPRAPQVPPPTLTAPAWFVHAFTERGAEKQLFLHTSTRSRKYCPDKEE